MEFAVILPLLVLIVFGCVDFGRFAHAYIAVTNAARAGAGYAAMNPYTATGDTTWRAELKAVIDAEMSQYDPALIKVELPSPVITYDNTTFPRYMVTVSYPFTTVIAWPRIPNQLTLERTVQMRGLR